jgi:hypothetical protein
MAAVRKLATGVAVAIAAFVCAAPASAITRQQANQAALAALRPASVAGDVILFGLPGPVKAGAVVTELTQGKLLKKPGKAAWLFWEDLDPGAMFEHASVLLLVDDATGKVTLRRTLSFYPLVDGRAPAFLASSAAYWRSSNHVFSKFADVTPVELRLPAGRAPAGVPAGALKDDCLLMVVLTPQNGGERENGTAAIAAWNGLATRLGMNGYVATSAGPLDVPEQTEVPSPFEDQVDILSLLANVESLVRRGCKDIAIYILGHGNGAPLPPRITLGVEPLGKKKASKGKKPETKSLTPEMLADLARGFRGEATFKFVIESCYAERFKPQLLLEPNVKIVLASSKENETSKFNLNGHPKVGKLALPRPSPLRPEFTHGMVEATIDVLDMVGPEVQGQPDLLPRLLIAGFAGEKKYDRAAFAGLTHPVEMHNLYAIQNLRHDHSPGTFSYVCGTVTGPPGKTVIVRIINLDSGQVAPSPPSMIKADGTLYFRATIGVPGNYRVEVVDVDGATVVTSADYTVPPSPQGSQPCPPP